MSQSIRILAEDVRFLNAADITASYQILNQNGGVTLADFLTGYINHPARQFFLQNLTDKTLWFSTNGSSNKFPLPSNGFLLSDISSNLSIKSGALYMSEGEGMWVKQFSGAPTTGGVYFTVWYGKGE